MGPDPEPRQSIGRFDGKRAVMKPDTRGPEPTYLLEMKGWMGRIILEPPEGLIGKAADILGKSVVSGPEGW